MRLPLLTPAEMTAEQRPLYEACDAMAQSEEYQGFEVKNAQGAFVGPWGVMLHFPELAVPPGQFTNVAQKLPGGPVPGPLYDAAVAKLGQQGFDAVVFIVIHYLALGVMLNAYDVPAGRATAWLS